jgi:cytochrome P450
LLAEIRSAVQRPRAPSDLPGPRPRVRDMGTLRRLLTDGPLVALERWANDAGGPVFVHWVGARPHVVVTGPDAVREVVLDETGLFQRNVQHTPVLFGRGVLALAGEPWRRSRGRLDPFFRKGQVDDALPIMRERTDVLLDRWAAHDGPLRPARDLSGLMLSILGRWLFRFPFDQHPELLRGFSRSFVVLTTEIVKRHFSPAPYWLVLPDRKLRQARVRVMAVMEEVVRHRQTLPPGDDLLGQLLEAETRGELSRQDVLDELVTLIVAGHETSATAFYPFLQGQHTCLGKHLALLEMGQFLISFLARFALEDFVGELEPQVRISLHPKGLALKLRPLA